MPSFQVPDSYSSSPPSTPDSRRNTSFNPFGASNPSTTPAGPPPSSGGSFTPVGPPPSTILGSSRLGFTYDSQPVQPPNFGKAPSFNRYDSPTSSPAFGSFGRGAGSKRSGLSNEFKVPGYGDEDTEDSYVGDSDQENSDFGFQQHGMGASINDIERMADEMEEDRYGHDQDMSGLRFDQSLPRSTNPDTNISFGQPDFRSPESLRRSREDQIMDFRKSIEDPTANFPGNFMFGRIAKDIYTQMGLPRVEEEDNLVLQTENIIARLYREGIKLNEDEKALSEVFTTIPRELLSLWAEYNNRIKPHQSEEYATAIGPGPRATNFAHANFLASLLLRLHHPSALGTAEPGETLKRVPVAQYLVGQLKAVPLVLLDWIDAYHNPYPDQLHDVMTAAPTPAHHRLFWETVINSLLRGNIPGVIDALHNAGWAYARQETEDVRSSGSGYHGKALENVEKVITDMVQLLHQCPGAQSDWDIASSDWTLFRLKASQCLENLKRFAEGKDQQVEEPAEFEASNFGMFSMAKSYSGTARKAESRVPWEVYQRLMSMYNLILGDTTSIIENSQDWCEATVGLTLWWNYNKEDRRKSHSHIPRDFTARRHDYLRKLAQAFYLATAESTEFQVNTVDAIEVGLASIFESNVEAAVGIMRSLSSPVSAGVVEIASIAGWLPRAETQNLIDMNSSLDQDDMDVLGLNRPSEQPEGIKDTTLIAYAEGLAELKTLESTPTSEHPRVVREGWEIAIEVLARLDSAELSEKQVGRLIRDLPLDEGAVVDKLWRLLNDLAMTSHAEHVAEQYANLLSEHTHKYGEALWYYSLAHKQSKVKDVLDLLISLSLLNSVAYPPEAELDNHLQRLISSPKAALTEMSRLDYEAAQLIQMMLSGYATLRKFYDLRDGEVRDPSSQKKSLSLATKVEAASALIAVINSSDDNIRGGLYDEERGAVVSVDFLLALLGEAMVFVDQPQLLLAPYQIDVLLKAIEDLETVPERVYSACNEFFETVIASTQGMKGSSPMDLLKKSTSSLSGTSSFAMVGSSMLASQLQRSIGSSGVLVKENAQRGWDWRKGLTAGMTSRDVLRILRYGLAREVARTCVLEADGQL